MPAEPRFEVPVYQCHLVCLRCGHEWMGPTFTPVKDDEPPRTRQYCDACADLEDLEAARRLGPVVLERRPVAADTPLAPTPRDLVLDDN